MDSKSPDMNAISCQTFIRRKGRIDMKVFLNPGHAQGGNPDPGAMNHSLGMRECDIALTIGSLAGKYLEAAGVTVKLLQSHNLAGESPGYPCVTDEANHWLADIFVSIHCNAFDGTARGAETYCYWDASEAAILASCIQQQVYDTEHRIDPGFPDRGVKANPAYAVLRATYMPAVLVEIGFIDQPDDAWLMANYGDDIARAIARGVTDYEGKTFSS